MFSWCFNKCKIFKTSWSLNSGVRSPNESRNETVKTKKRNPLLWMGDEHSKFPQPSWQKGMKACAQLKMQIIEIRVNDGVWGAQNSSWMDTQSSVALKSAVWLFWSATVDWFPVNNLPIQAHLLPVQCKTSVRCRWERAHTWVFGCCTEYVNLC